MITTGGGWVGGDGGYSFRDMGGTPNFKLFSSGTGWENLYIGSLEDSTIFMVFDHSGDIGYGSKSVSVRQNFVTLGNTNLAINTGNVGIGTVSPTAKQDSEFYQLNVSRPLTQKCGIISISKTYQSGDFNG
jgi:hypothetical protein